MIGQKQRNLEAMFELFDGGGDGHITAADLAAHAEKTCGALGLPPGSPYWTTIHTALDTWWEHLCRYTDRPDGRIPNPECVTVMQTKLVDDDAFFGSTVEPIAATIFHVLDSDGDDVISTDQFVAIYLASGMSKEIAVGAFEQIDTDGDGRINIGEFVDVVRDAFTSDDPHSPGAWFFGARPADAAEK